jgi:PAS domain S-box-containing protein
MANPFLDCLAKVPSLGLGCWRKDGQLYDVNEGFLRLFGFTQQQVEAGQVRWTDLVPPEFAATTAFALEEILSRGECTPIEIESLSHNGKRIPVIIGAAAFGNDINDAGTFYVVDMSQRKRRENGQSPLADSQVLALTDRQRAICLLVAHGWNQKRVAALLDIALRTVESERQHAAKALGLPTPILTIWSVENREALACSLKDCSLFGEALEAIIAGKPSGPLRELGGGNGPSGGVSPSASSPPSPSPRSLL